MLLEHCGRKFDYSVIRLFFYLEHLSVQLNIFTLKIGILFAEFMSYLYDFDIHITIIEIIIPVYKICYTPITFLNTVIIRSKEVSDLITVVTGSLLIFGLICLHIDYSEYGMLYFMLECICVLSGLYKLYYIRRYKGPDKVIHTNTVRRSDRNKN